MHQAGRVQLRAAAEAHALRVVEACEGPLRVEERTEARCGAQQERHLVRVRVRVRRIRPDPDPDPNPDPNPNPNPKPKPKPDPNPNPNLNPNQRSSSSATSRSEGASSRMVLARHAR